MSYAISYYSATVKASIELWPAGISAEIRAKRDEGIGRAFFCALVGRRIVILHGFIKKTPQTPKKELQLARRRLREVLHADQNRK